MSSVRNQTYQFETWDELKARLMSVIEEEMILKRLSQTEAAKEWGATQPIMSSICHQSLRKVSLERVCEILKKIGYVITINIFIYKDNQSINLRVASQKG